MTDRDENLDSQDIDRELEQENNELQDQLEEEVQQEAPVDPEVQKAKANGYMTREEWEASGRDPAKFKTPEQFNKFGEAYPEFQEAIKSLKSKLDQRDKEIESVLEYQKRTAEREYQRARQQLEAELQQAREMGDGHGIERLVTERNKMEWQETQKQMQLAEQERQSTLQSFIARNKNWFGVDPVMTDECNRLEQQIRENAQRNGLPITWQQVAEGVENVMRFKYPDKVGVSREVQKPSLSISQSQSATNRDVGSLDSDSKVFQSLDSDYKHLYTATKRMLEKQGYKYTEKDFVNQLRKDGEI